MVWSLDGCDWLAKKILGVGEKKEGCVAKGVVLEEACGPCTMSASWWKQLDGWDILVTEEMQGMKDGLVGLVGTCNLGSHSFEKKEVKRKKKH